MILHILNGKIDFECGYAKLERAITVLLPSLNENEKAEKAASKLTVTDLNVDGGLEKLLQKLDSIFKTEKMQESYDVYPLIGRHAY